MKKYLMMALLAAHFNSANAQFITGNKLLEWLDKKDEAYTLIANGYITGVADALSDKLCVPGKVSVRQISDIVHKALKQLPAQRHMAADVLVYGALRTAYPCDGDA